MAQVTFISFDGNSQEVNVEPGTSVMQAAIDNGVDGILADCGGSCSCATCHCYVEESWVSKVEPASEIEQEMLECVVDPEETSRLSCQVIMSDELDGLVVRLPKSQF